MDLRDLSVNAGSVTYGITAKTPGKQDASKRCSLAVAVSAKGSIRQSTELSGTCIGLDLTIPRLRVKLAEPLAKGSELFRRESTYLVFDLLDFAHLVLLRASNDRKYGSEEVVDYNASHPAAG